MSGADVTPAGSFATCDCSGAQVPPKRVRMDAAALALLLLISNAFAADEPSTQPTPPVSSTITCRDCGIVRSTREIRTERRAPPRADTYVSSSQYLQSRPFDQQPLVGPAFTLSWNAKGQTNARVGAVGSPEMQQRLIDISYEITVRFDDGRYGLIEQAELNDLRAGDRVRVINGRVERLK
jgi:hypothetical protein